MRLIVETRKYNLCADLLIRLGAANITIHPSRHQESIYRLHMSLRPGDGERYQHPNSTPGIRDAQADMVNR